MRFFWWACLCGIPLVLPIFVFPYAEVGGPGQAAGVFLFREYFVQALIGLAAIVAVGYVAVRELKDGSASSGKLVLAVTVALLFGAGFASYEAATSGAAPWSEDGSSETAWYPGDGGRAAPYQSTYRTLTGTDGPETEIHVQHRGPWIVLALIVLAVLSVLGFLATFLVALSKEKPAWGIATVLTVLVAIPFLLALAVIYGVSGSNWG